MTTPLPILYSFRRCPFAMRARLALDVSEQRCELREILLRNKPAEMLRASAKGTVPVLIDTSGNVIDESLEIMAWALQRHDPDRWLTPTHGTLREMLDLIARIDTEFKSNLDRYKYPTRFGDADPNEARLRASEELDELEVRLLHREFLFGDHIALADMAIMPFVRQFANVSIEWFAEQPWSRLQAWLNRLQQTDRFVRIMKPLPPWIPGSLGVPFPFRQDEASA